MSRPGQGFFTAALYGLIALSLAAGSVTKADTVGRRGR
jgi:hypothetical protein